MATYNVATYNSGVFYNQAVAPVPPAERKKVSTVALNLDRLNDQETIALGISIKNGLTGNSNYTTPDPPLASGATIITAGQTKLQASIDAAAFSKGKTSDKDDGIEAIRGLIRGWGSYVQKTSGGDKTKIESANLSVRADTAPIGTPTQVMALAITSGDSAGELDLQWEPVRGAKMYEIQVSPDPITGNSWANQTPSTKSKAILLGLTSGQRVHVRVRAIGAAGPGAWSDDATKIVP